MEAWWAHPEPILVSLLTSQDLSERKFAVDKILSVRMGADVGSTAVRSYKVPDRKLVNLNATSCWNPNANSCGNPNANRQAEEGYCKIMQSYP